MWMVFSHYFLTFLFVIYILENIISTFVVFIYTLDIEELYNESFLHEKYKATKMQEKSTWNSSG